MLKLYDEIIKKLKVINAVCVIFPLVAMSVGRFDLMCLHLDAKMLTRLNFRFC